MNIFFLTIIIFIIIYILLSWFAKSSSKKLSNYFLYANNWRKFILFYAPISENIFDCFVSMNIEKLSTIHPQEDFLATQKQAIKKEAKLIRNHN